MVLGVQALVRRDVRLGLAPLLVALLYLPRLLTSRHTYIFHMTPVVPFLAILVATGLSRIAGRRAAPGAPQALGFGGGAFVAAAAWTYVGATAGLALGWLPFLVGFPVAFEYYQRLTWFVTWK